MTESVKHLQIHKLEDMNIYQNLGESHNPMQIGSPSITIHVAPKGSLIYNDLGEDTGSKSQWGHTYISIRGINPVTHDYEQISMGLSPGDDWGTSKDNLSFNDHVRYKNASSLHQIIYSFIIILITYLRPCMIIKQEKLNRQIITLLV